jgi:hypothetical protein
MLPNENIDVRMRQYLAACEPLVTQLFLLYQKAVFRIMLVDGTVTTEYRFTPEEERLKSQIDDTITMLHDHYVCELDCCTAPAVT